MNIKVSLRYILFGTALIAGVVGVFAIKKALYVAYGMIQKKSMPHLIEVHFQHIYSPVVREDLSVYAHKALEENDSSFDIGTFCRKIKKEFSLIKTIWATMKASGVLDVFICGVRPELKVNNTHILGNKRRLFTKKDFETYAEPLFKEVHINKAYYDHKLALGLYGLLQRIPEDVYKEYKVLYKKPTDIMLVPKDSSKRYRVIVDEKTLFDEKRRSALAGVEADVRKKDTETKRKRGVLTFDIRFKKRILVG